MPSRDSGSALLLVKRGSHDAPIESTEANEVSEGRTTGSAIVACELADLLLISCYSRCFHLTRSILENPAFNYGFFRPNPLAFQMASRKDGGHGCDITG